MISSLFLRLLVPFVAETVLNKSCLHGPSELPFGCDGLLCSLGIDLLKTKVLPALDRVPPSRRLSAVGLDFLLLWTFDSANLKTKMSIT